MSRKNPTPSFGCDVDIHGGCDGLDAHGYQCFCPCHGSTRQDQRTGGGSMSARDELAELIRETGLRAIGRHAIDRAADRIYAAGWVSPDDVARIKAEALRDAAEAIRNKDHRLDLGNEEHATGWRQALNEAEHELRQRAAAATEAKP